MAYGKIAKKVSRAARRVARKRYIRKGAGYGSGVRLNKVVKDLALLKRSLNTEKKYIDTGGIASTSVGQQFVNTFGNVVNDITPVPTQGTGYGNRIGKSIKVVAMALQYQLEQQSATAGPRRFKLFICKTKGAPQATSDIATNFLSLNPITSVYDYMSNRNINYFKDYVVLQTKTIYLKDDAISGQTQLTTGKCVMKLNHHIQYVDNSNTVSDGQLFWYICADAGNAGTTDTTTLDNVAITAANTGASFQTYVRYWYVDN